MNRKIGKRKNAKNENLKEKLELQAKSEKSLKSARGITLVALVITIIIIIILASITMNMAFGDNGLIKQAQLAKDMAANSVIAEQEGMNSLMGEFANTMGGNEIDNPTEPDPEEPDPEPGPGEEIPEGTITFGEVIWSGYRASVTVSSSAVNSNGISTSETSSNEENSTDTKYTIQYQVNGTEDNQWKTINSGESVEDVILGDESDFTISMNDYNNAIIILNEAANKYNNSKYSSYARCVGSDPSIDDPTNPQTDNPGYYTESESWFEDYDGKFKRGDNHGEIDLNQVETLGILNISDTYWLASRREDPNAVGVEFRIYNVDNIYSSSEKIIQLLEGGNRYFYSSAHGLRPVFHLKSNIKITGGSGTSGVPYILGV